MVAGFLKNLKICTETHLKVQLISSQLNYNLVKTRTMAFCRSCVPIDENRRHLDRGVVPIMKENVVCYH